MANRLVPVTLSKIMQYFHQILIGFIIAAHTGFILFVLFGAILVAKWQKLAWLHIPALAWGLFVELGSACPLTALEQSLRVRWHLPNYGGGFIPHYFPYIFANVQRVPSYIVVLIIIVINLLAYRAIFFRRQSKLFIGRNRH